MYKIFLFLQFYLALGNPNFRYNFNVPCDFPVLDAPDIKKREITYVIRNSSLNSEFNKAFTFDALENHLKGTKIMSMFPGWVSSAYRVVNFSSYWKNHFLKYENMTLNDILKVKPLDTRIIQAKYNTTHTILSRKMKRLHNCSFIEKYGLQPDKEYFISAKGKSVNFHSHNEIFTQISHGSKLWFTTSSQTLQKIFWAQNMTPAMRINELLENKNVKKCITNTSDVIHLPDRVNHATINLENTLAHGCVPLKTEKQVVEAFDMSKFDNIQDLL